MPDQIKAPASTALIPQLSCILLKDNCEVRLDEYLGSRSGQLLISFEKEHFPQIEQWIAQCDKNDENAYHIAVISNRFMLMRDMFIQGLRDSFPTEAVQNRTLITFTYLDRFCENIGHTDTEQPARIKF